MKADVLTRSSLRLSSRRLLAICLLALCSTPGRALSQEYQSDPIDEKGAGRNRVVAQQCVRDGGAYAANKDKFLEYFNNYHFPAMTRTEPEKMGELGRLREDLFKVYLWKTSNPELQRDLTDAALKRMGKIVQSPAYHPAVRYNAILVIGMLDEKYSPDGKQPPTPKATKGLTSIVDGATTSNRFPPSVVLGAIIGLERHAQYAKNIAPDAVAGMTAALIKLIGHD